ncbi:High molecular weight form of myosin-1 (High molecular weight form of myosin I) (HMWMI) [Durusdinium trenchii]|uniref:High molecular weight form of myosin-1 (High molecular weight form of myosin I) (HMWMI) n=1 Tax=Durusdinium trenchii TaxID=1381693 RepID=A0ABP0ILD9_9DINO
MPTFSSESYVWLEDEDDMYVPAKVASTFESGKSGQVYLVQDGVVPKGARTVKVSAGAGVWRMDEQSLEPIEDMVQLKQLEEPEILHNLRMRYERDEIYTRVSKILVSLNPFQMLPIYSPQVMDDYLRNGSRDLAPHVYGVADDAYRAMSGNKRDQSCIVSGESGAGKTEATKLFLQYIAEKSRREAPRSAAKVGKDGKEEESIQHKVLEANPLMEAFGNAKTVRNDNSSRFGKWIEIQFSNTGEIIGGSIENYLLEKSRLVKQGEGERNYHIFYQLCAAGNVDPDVKEMYQLSDASQYFYLNQSKKTSIEIDGVDDADEWKSTKMAMDVISMKDKDREKMLTLVAGIMHLGNIRFGAGKSEGTSLILNEEMVSLAAEQLGTDSSKLSKALTKNKLRVGSEVVEPDNDPAKAADARDALAKQIYASLFDWLIERINKSLGQQKNFSHNIGVLDIFGFESFEINSFEQLCINYCNEKLQGHFNDHIFKLEMAEYKKEGVNCDKIDFKDNSETIALIDGKGGKGILGKVAEEIKRAQKTDDDGKLLAQIRDMERESDGKVHAPSVKEIKKRPHLNHAFVFVHFAGPVEYDVRGFIEKNRDILQLGLYEIGVNSGNSLLKKLFQEKVSQDVKKTPLGIQFQQQLSKLMKKLETTEPHFVRCIKPNKKKAAATFTSKMVMDQLRYAGVLEVCRIRKLGYPVRRDFNEFLNTYSCLVSGKPSNVKALCKALEGEGILDSNEYQIGKNKVFMRDEQFEVLQARYEVEVRKYMIKIQRFVRMCLAVKKKAKWDKIRKAVKKAAKKGNVEELEAALLQVGELPYGGRHLQDIDEAQERLEELHEQNRIAEMLEAAIESKDLTEIKRALKAAEEKGMGKSDLANEARKLIKKIMDEKKLRDDLRAAVEKGDTAGLEAALKKAEKAGIGASVEARDATAVLDRLKEEEYTRKELKKAIGQKDAANIRKHMNKMVELGCRDDPLVKDGEAVVKEVAKASKEQEQRQQRLVVELEEAMESQDLARLNELEIEVLQLNMGSDRTVKEAMKMRKALEKNVEVSGALSAEIRAVKYKAGTNEGISAADINSLGSALDDATKNGVAKDHPSVVEAEALLERLEQQLEVQKDVDGIVREIDSIQGSKGEKGAKKKEKKEVIVATLEACSRFGIETGNAKKLRYWLNDLETAEADKNAEALAKTRQKNLDRLKEASKDEVEEQAMQRLAKLSSDRHRKLIDTAKDDQVYDLKKFYKIRTNEDFTEPLPQEERALAAKLKLWSRSKPIPKSLTVLSEEQNRTALRINRAILQYCGDMSTSFPATLAQYMLVKGLEDPQMCDEIFMQLCKHVFANPRPESSDRAWLLMCMASKTFPPTEQFAPHLVNFLLKHQNLPGLPGNYARLCIVQLDATIELGPSWFKPNLEEIQAYRKRPPILATINLVTGDVLQYPVGPELRVAQVLEIIRRSQNIVEEDIETPVWGIFVKDAKENGKASPRDRLKRFYQKYNPDKIKHIDLFLQHWQGKEEELFAKLVDKYGPEPDEEEQVKKGKKLLSVPVTSAMSAAKMLGLTSTKKAPPAPKVAWALPWWSHLGDVYLRMTTQGKEPVFEFKRRLFLPNMDKDELLYHQLLHDVQTGDLAFNEEVEVAELALIAVAMQQDSKKPPKVEKLAEAGLTKYMSSYWRRRKSPDDWARVAVNAAEKLPRNEKKLIARFIQICENSPVYGMCLFMGRRNDGNEDFTIGIDAFGVHFISRVEGSVKVVDSYLYKNIMKYGSTVSFFWLQINAADSKKKKGVFATQGSNLLIYTLQSWEIYEVVFDFTHAPTDEE